MVPNSSPHPGRSQTEPLVGPATAKKLNLFRSLRSYRQYLDRVAIQCYEGARPMADLTRAAAFAKVASEIFLAENQLARAGLDEQFADHPLGADGGLGDILLPRGYVEKTVKRKTGISPKGTEIEETVSTAKGVASLNEAIAELGDLI